MNGNRKRGRPAYPDILTPGEWRVAKAARFGMTNRQIAERFEIGVEAVKFHLSNILLKLSMDRRQDLVTWPGMPAADRAIAEADMEEPTRSGSDGKPLIPPGFTRVFPYLFVENARDYLRFLDEGLNGEIIDIHAAPNGVVLNAHIRFGDTTIMVSQAQGDQPKSQATMYLYVQDAEEAMERGVAAGGREVSPVAFRPYGEQQGGLGDPSGNIWWLSQRLAPGGY
ncbi:LuxR C-terminal-related transcriptional regulator [uncultured Caulobacter sp.]|uniref:LuxR C-terminal-related transcriptional regulator n=1 Tax=uncultured Caulobacter sp. TaxID=158749 RepID=UPI0026116824|nr:LuxR C-terminal-related transcriptional regulator [uncultured Caulobacter sp.]